VLADEGLVLRENDPEDNRRVLVRLSPRGISAMERFFDAVDPGA
jgi:DNA-binding MarR family transcriptional regulator